MQLRALRFRQSVRSARCGRSHAWKGALRFEAAAASAAERACCAALQLPLLLAGDLLTPQAALLPSYILPHTPSLAAEMAAARLTLSPLSAPRRCQHEPLPSPSTGAPCSAATPDPCNTVPGTFYSSFQGGVTRPVRAAGTACVADGVGRCASLHRALTPPARAKKESVRPREDQSLCSARFASRAQDIYAIPAPLRSTTSISTTTTHTQKLTPKPNHDAIRDRLAFDSLATGSLPLARTASVFKSFSPS